MKKIKNILIVILVIIGAVIIQYSCAKKEKEQILGNQNLFSFSALSSANILSDTESVNLSSAKTTNGLVKMSSDNIDMDKVNSYLQMMENMLIGDGPILISESASDRGEYAVKLVFESKDLSGKTTNYILYFNETVLKDFDDDLFEMEEEFVLNGLAVVDGVEYKMTGQKEVEDGEIELEIKISLDKNNYVLIEQESERGEEEYSYVVYKEGIKVLSMSFELENNKDVEIVIRSNESGYNEVYKFYKKNRNIDEIIIKHQVNGRETTIVVTSYQDSSNETIYEYKVTENDKTFRYAK